MNTDHLRPATRDWFNSVLNEYALEEHHRRLLLAAAECWDRAEEAREALAEGGLTFVDRFNQERSRPQVTIEKDSKILFSRLLRELQLDTEQPAEARIPRQAGY